MAEPLSEKRLAEIREHQQWYPTDDGRDLLTEVDRLTAQLREWQAAGRSTDLEGDVRDHLCDLADWQTADSAAPDWLVTAVLDLLGPVAAERDRLAKERDAIGRADKAGARWARKQIEDRERTIADLKGAVQRVRDKHPEHCGGGCAAVTCECGPGDTVCAECETPYPCATLRALDGTEAGR